MLSDIDDVLEPLLRRTLVFWLLPYAFVYLFIRLAARSWEWVTKPSEEEF